MNIRIKISVYHNFPQSISWFIIHCKSVKIPTGSKQNSNFSNDDSAIHQLTRNPTYYALISVLILVGFFKYCNCHCIENDKARIIPLPWQFKSIFVQIIPNTNTLFKVDNLGMLNWMTLSMKLDNKSYLSAGEEHRAKLRRRAPSNGGRRNLHCYLTGLINWVWLILFWVWNLFAVGIWLK